MTHPAVPAPPPANPFAPPPVATHTMPANGGMPYTSFSAPPTAPAAAPAAPVTSSPGTPPTTPAAPAPAPTPAPAAPVSLEDLRVNGTMVPPELQGKTFREVVDLYTRVKGTLLTTVNNPPAPPPPVAPAPAPAPTGPKKSFWEEPEAAIQSIVDSRLDAKLETVTAPLAADARQRAAQSITQLPFMDQPDVVSHVANIMAQVDPRGQTDAMTWRSAYELAVGRAATEGKLRPAAAPAAAAPPAPAPTTTTQPAANGGYYPTTVPATPAFFVEPVSAGGGHGAPRALSPAEARVAAGMNMSPEEYRAWSGGAR